MISAAYLLSLKGEKGFDDPGLLCPISSYREKVRILRFLSGDRRP